MKKIGITLLSFMIIIINLQAQELPLLKVSGDNHYLITENNEPFFWLGGTAWEMLHRLNLEETEFYLSDRANKGFTVIQTVILAELDGLKTPNAYGEIPLMDLDPTKLNEKYFEHIDKVVRQAEALGLYLGLLPTWGDKFLKKWGIGPEIFTPENAEIFGELIAARYLDNPNIIWILGGDRVPENNLQYEIIRAMAKGIKTVDKKHLISYHPWGSVKATDIFNEKWLDFDMFQTVHDRQTKDYEFVRASKAMIPERPVINGEPRYENIPVGLSNDPMVNGWMDDSDIRTSAYWTMLSGAAGYTYGCNDIWQMYSIGRLPVIQARTGWREALKLPGSTQLTYMKQLLISFPWFEMRNDQTLILNDNPGGATHIVCSIGKNHDFILAYTPMGKPIKVDLSAMSAQKVNAFWYNPRSGESIKIGEYKVSETPEFIPWSVGRGSDMVLIVTDTNSLYKIPGLGK
ncbi:MAG: endoglucanase [Bacteroidetes bacterium]|nr:MAG: endoglucanase [Bacteroidota bacterium]